MTLQDGIRKVYMLLDEHSISGVEEHDPDMEKKMADFFDIAQKDVAHFRKVRKTAVYDADGTATWTLPADFGEPIRLWCGGRVRPMQPICAGTMIAPNEGWHRNVSFNSGGYTVQNIKPENWETVYTDFFTQSGTDEAPVYSAVTGDTAPLWQPDTYYRGPAKKYVLPYRGVDVERVKVNDVELAASGWVLTAEPQNGGNAFVTLTETPVPPADGANNVEIEVVYTVRYTLEYAAIPQKVTAETTDFEVDDDAAACMPFFVAAQHLATDLVGDSTKLLTTYYTMRQALIDTTPTDGAGGGGSGGMRQSFYR